MPNFSLKLDCGYSDLNDVIYQMPGTGNINGPTITGIAKVEFAFNHVHVYFDSFDALCVAQRLTGWTESYRYSAVNGRSEKCLYCAFDKVQDKYSNDINLLYCEVPLSDGTPHKNKLYFASFDLH